MQEPTAPISLAPSGMPRRDRVLIACAVLVLGGLALGFWKANGASVFAELMSAAWSLCF